MKKLLSLVVLAALIGGGSLFAQQNSNSNANSNSSANSNANSNSNSKFKESEYYYYNVPIEKIYVYRLGYMVLYRKGVNQMAKTYLPAEWFTDAGGKGELIGIPGGKEWPSMTVYYKSGEFSHVRLRVRREKAHESWGVVPLNLNIDDYFKNIEEVKLEF